MPQNPNQPETTQQMIVDTDWPSGSVGQTIYEFGIGGGDSDWPPEAVCGARV